MAARGLSAENVAFGMGGELLQNVNRDTLKFAMKASAIEIGGHWSDVYKDPVTDAGKRSKRGRLALSCGTTPGARCPRSPWTPETTRSGLFFATAGYSSTKRSTQSAHACTPG